MTGSPGWLRRAGRGRLADGGQVLWSVAEGGRGRRWRLSQAGGPVRAVLLELDRAGRFARLEVDAEAGMLTLHPDGGGAMVHGNVVTAGGVRPIELAWSVGCAVSVDGCPLVLALTAAGDGGGEAVVVGPGLEVSAGRGTSSLDIDERGIPVLAEADEWPLED